MAQSTTRRVSLWVIMGLLFVGLVGFGSTGLRGQMRSIGTVAGQPVPVQAYADALRDQIAAFSDQNGVQISFAQAQARGMDRNVLAQLVAAKALDAEAARLGLSVGDTIVRDEILRVSAFQGLNGQFDRERYKMALEGAGLTEAAYETGLRADLSRGLLQGAVIGALPMPEVYATTMVGHSGETRRVTWAALTADALTDPLPEPSQADLQAWYDANPAAFTLPELRQISYVWLTPTMILDQVTVDDADVRSLYDQRITQFVQEERRLVERLVFLDDAAATAAKARLDAGEVTFEQLTVDRGLQLSDIDLGDVTRAQLEGAGEAIFAAEPGAVLGPLPSALGPALFRLNAVLAADEVTFDQAAPDLRAELADDRARRMIADGAEGINDLLASGATLEDLAANTDMELGTINWNDSVTDGVAAYEPFRQAAAAVAEDDFPTLGSFYDGGVFLLRLDGITPPVLQPIGDVTDALRTAWDAQARQTALLAEAGTRAARVREAGSYDLPDIGLTITTEPALTRTSFVPGPPQGFTDAVFGMAAGDVQVLDNGAAGVVIARLDAIAAPDPTDPGVIAQQAATAGQLSQSLARDVLDAYSRAVQRDTDVAIDEAAVNAVNAQFP